MFKHYLKNWVSCLWNLHLNCSWFAFGLIGQRTWHYCLWGWIIVISLAVRRYYWMHKFHNILYQRCLCKFVYWSSLHCKTALTSVKAVWFGLSHVNELDAAAYMTLIGIYGFKKTVRLWKETQRIFGKLPPMSTFWFSENCEIKEHILIFHSESFCTLSQ